MGAKFESSMLARLAGKREGRFILAALLAISLSGCGMSKMSDILTDKPAAATDCTKTVKSGSASCPAASKS